MAADFKLVQNLKMSLNAQIKHLVPENLSDIPPQDEWKPGRIWFNTKLGKLQGVFLKLDPSTGLPLESQELEVRIIGSDTLGPTKDGEYWPDGLFDFNEQTKISDAIDEINESLKDLAPAEATLLNGDLIIKNELRTGKISRQDAMAPDQLRLVGVSEGDEINYIITESSVEAILPVTGNIVKNKQQVQFGKADQGLITVFFDNIQVDEGIDLKANFNEESRDYEGAIQGFDPEITQTVLDAHGLKVTKDVNPNKEKYRSETGSLTINTVEKYNNFKKWQRGTGTINFGKLDGQPPIEPGRHTFFVKHSNILNGPYLTNEAEIFYDPNKTPPITTIDNFSIISGNDKYVSGIQFKNNAIKFNLNLTVTDVFNYTYWDRPISLTCKNTDAGLINWNHEKSNLFNSTIPKYNDKIILTNYIINYTGVNQTEEFVTLKAKSGKVTTSWGQEVSQTLNILIDTYPIRGNSTWLKETFFDEEFRLKDTTNFDNMNDINAAVGTWDSTKLLSSGEAQQYLGELQIAQRDFRNFGCDVDYTIFANDIPQRYFRPFKAINKPNSNGTLKFITTGNIETGGDIEVLIKFPGLTGWLSLTELYDIQTFNNTFTQDGVGCATSIRKNANITEIDWTIGTNSTINSGYGYVLQVIIYNKDIKISEIEEISPSWR